MHLFSRTLLRHCSHKPGFVRWIQTSTSNPGQPSHPQSAQQQPQDSDKPKSNPATAPTTPRPFATTSTHPLHTHVYVLPTLSNRLVFHARLPLPANPIERFLIVAGYAYRRMRFVLWDEAVAANWYRALGPSVNAPDLATNPNTRLQKTVFEAGNRWGTRKADDEYFFKQVPLRAREIEFIYPPSIPLKQIKTQLNTYLQSRSQHSRALFLYTILIFPPLMFLAKFVLPIFANFAFVYVAFRVAGAWRAMTAANRVQVLLDHGRCVFTQSPEFQAKIEQVCGDVTAQLKQEAVEMRSQNRVGGGDDGSALGSENVWKWDGKGDLHDEVVLKLEQDLSMHEWSRTYRRARMVALVHYGSK